MASGEWDPSLDGRHKHEAIDPTRDVPGTSNGQTGNYLSAERCRERFITLYPCPTR